MEISRPSVQFLAAWTRNPRNDRVSSRARYYYEAIPWSEGKKASAGINLAAYRAVGIPRAETGAKPCFI